MEDTIYRDVWESESGDQGKPGRLGLLARTDMNRGIKCATKQTITQADGPPKAGLYGEHDRRALLPLDLCS